MAVQSTTNTTHSVVEFERDDHGNVTKETSTVTTTVVVDTNGPAVKESGAVD